MNDWKDVSAGSGLRRRIRFHEVEKVIEEEIVQPNMGAILDANHRQMNMHSNKSRRDLGPNGWRKVASIPFVLIEHWRNTEGLDFFNPDHRPALMARLNSGEYSKLRTAPGKLVAEHREI